MSGRRVQSCFMRMYVACADRLRTYLPASMRDSAVAMARSLALALAIALCIGAPATAYAQSITRSIAAGSDDAEEAGPGATGTRSPGYMDLVSSDIELVVDNDTGGGYSQGTQKVGLRFTSMTIPAGATITSAYLTFRAVAADSPMNNTGATNLTISGQLIGNAPTFSSTSGDISSRTLTTAAASWAPPSWTTGTDYVSPSIVSVIQEIVNQGAWASGNAIAIVITGTGHRSAQSYNTSPATAAKLTVTYSPATYSISGRVFEDVNYGGGAGRSLAASSGSVRSGAQVELFNSAGAYVTSTTTDGSGNYTFSGLGAGNYTVRVVSSSVTSSRTGYVSGLRPVMTYRTNASTGIAVGVTDFVGGHVPATQDVANAAAGWVLNATTGVFTGSGSGQAHAFAPVTIGATNVTGVDFGWNFATVSNANSTGQGSLFAAITNANTLGGDASLAQSGRPAGIENALFMISNGTSAAGLRAANNYFSGGIATISPTATSLLTISAPLVLDAQTQPGWTAAPLIELNGTSAGASRNGLTVSGGGSVIRGFTINRFTNHGIYLITAGGNTVQGNYVGTNSAGAAASANAVHGIFADNVANNLIGGISAAQRNVVSGNTGYGIVLAGASATGNTVSGNYVGLNAAGTAALANSIGVDVEGAATGNTIGGTSAAARNVVSGNSQMGVLLQFAGTSGNTVAGNFIGTNAAGSAALPNGTHGVNIKNNASSNTVGGATGTAGNVISGNAGSGIAIEGAAASGNVVQGNLVGLNAAGTAAIANVSHGVLVSNAPTNTIGGTAAAARNVVSGNGGSGVYILGATASGNTVLGNYVGTNAAGTSAVANGANGVWVEAAPSNTIGGTAGGARNVIAGNTNHGVHLYSNTSGTLVQGNYIGTNASGTAAVPNQVHGVTISGGASNNTIGGTTSAARNVISGNQTAGVRLATTTTSGNTIAGNYIGVDVSGTAALGNGSFGVIVEATNTTIGGATAASGNVIANNGADGVAVVNVSLGNGILRNAIFSNGGLGIDLADDGVTANDGTKSASLPNSGMDFPVFESVVLVGTTLTVTGYVGSAPSSPTFANAQIEIFKSDNDASGSGEGLAYLGSFTTDANGLFGGDLAVTGLAVGERISGTATDASNNTSEFGPQFVVTGSTADLSITMVDSPDPASDTGDLLYTLLITNIGPATATNVIVTDILPGTVTFQSATPSQGSCSGTTTVTCDLGAILAGGTASVEVLVVTGGPGTISNTASVAATQSDPVPANNTSSASTQVSNQVNNDVPLTQYRRIHGFVDSTVTGGTLRTQPNSGNACLVGASSTATLSGIPGTATIVNAYLYWAGSGTTVDSQVTLDGASLTADRTWQADYTLGSSTYNYFGGFEDVTAQVAAKRNGSYTFSGLTVATGAPWCASAAVLAGWSLIVIYEDSSLSGKTLLLYDGFDLTRNGSGNYVLTGIYAAGPPEAKAVFLTWEGDETLAGSGETLKFNGTNLSDGLNPVNNVYNSTINSLGVTTSYGVDLDSFNVSSLIAERDTLATAQVSTGPDLVVLNALLLQVKSNIIAGRVFEDVNYGGGAGRGYAAAAAAAPGFAVARPNARLELYDVDGNFLRTTTTDANGSYGFAGLVDGDYFVRAVNNSFTSSRPGATGSEWPVQTYRVDASTGTVNPVTNEVGGASPAAQDSPANLSSANLSTLTAQSVTRVRIITGVAVYDTDFGYSFNTIANKNNAGQGSLRQFLANANTLGNAGLAQAGRPATIDNAVFMLADGTARPGLTASYPNLFVGGVATIAPATALPPVTDPVVLDAQTQPGWTSVPIIELAGSAAAGSGFAITAGNSTVRGFVINGFSAASSGGISISGTGANTIEGNYLGTNAAGAAAAQNYHGIYINGSNGNFIGGSANSQRNLISGNQFSGIRLQPGSSGNFIRGNFIGVNAAGTAALLNNVGVYLNDAPNNTVGGTAPGEGNVVSGNSQIGIYLVAAGASGNVIQGNTVGLNAARTAAIPNVARGIEVCCSGNGGSNNTIGGLTAAAANVVSGNGGVGVRVQAGTGNGILGNAIYGNGGIGIDLGIDGVTANDGAKPAGQPNLYMDVPVFTSAGLVGSTLTVTGYVGNAPSLPLFAGARVEIFKSDGDPSGSGEGQVYLGFLTTDSSGNFSGSLTVSGLAIGDRITGTATDGSNNTSEFAVFVSLGAPAITVTKSSAVLSDPVNDVTNPKRIPGAVIEYSITLLNSGGGSPDAGSVLITDPIDRATLAFRVGTGVTFTDGATGSGVSLGSVTYSATPAPGPYVYNYTPVLDVDGYDGNITSFSVTTNGTLAFGGTPPPSFSLKFQVKVK